MNNKGFATSFILFSLLILFLVVMGILVFTLNNSSKLNNKIKSNLVNDIEDTFEGDSRKIKAVDIYYDDDVETSGNTTTNGNQKPQMNCSDLQCAIDKINSLLSD